MGRSQKSPTNRSSIATKGFHTLMDNIQRSKELNVSDLQQVPFRARSHGKLKRSGARNGGGDNHHDNSGGDHKTVFYESENIYTRLCSKEESCSEYREFFPRSIRQWGGKDRHSKVLTSRGKLRDRRVRLSVSTALRFYDVQDKLGFDQPSKAIEWLLDKAQWALDSLPQSCMSMIDCSLDFCKANKRSSNEHLDSYRDDIPLPAMTSSMAGDNSPNSISTNLFHHVDHCNIEAQSSLSNNNYDAMKGKAIVGDMGNSDRITSVSSLTVDVALQGEGNFVLEAHNHKLTNAKKGLIKELDVEADEEIALLKKPRTLRSGDIVRGSLITPPTTASDLHSPIVMINQAAYLYCNSPPFIQASYIINLATDEQTSNAGSLNSSIS